MRTLLTDWNCEAGAVRLGVDHGRASIAFTGALQTFTAPNNGTYHILAIGASGGNAGGNVGGGFSFEWRHGRERRVRAGSGGFGGGGGGGGSNTGGGGTSFDAGSHPLFSVATALGNGSVTITAPTTTTPEPSSLALFGTGLAGLIALLRRRGFKDRSKLENSR